jgi:hypothetical protein
MTNDKILIHLKFTYVQNDGKSSSEVKHEVTEKIYFSFKRFEVFHFFI